MKLFEFTENNLRSKNSEDLLKAPQRQSLVTQETQPPNIYTSIIITEELKKAFNSLFFYRDGTSIEENKNFGSRDINFDDFLKRLSDSKIADIILKPVLDNISRGVEESKSSESFTKLRIKVEESFNKNGILSKDASSEIINFLKTLPNEIKNKIYRGENTFCGIEITNNLDKFLNIVKLTSQRETKDDVDKIILKAFDELAENSIKIGGKFPVEEALIPKINSYRITRALNDVFNLNNLKLVSQLEKVPLKFFQTRDLQIKLEPKSNSKENYVLKLKSESIKGEFIFSDLTYKENFPKQNINTPVSINNTLLTNKSTIEGDYNFTDWVFGSIKEIEVSSKTPSLLSAQMNIMKAIPDASFQIKYDSEFWKTKFNIDDFPKYLQIQLAEKGIHNKLQFIETKHSTDGIEEGVIWPRDYIIKGKSEDILTKQDEKNDLDILPNGKSIYFNGGGMYPVGRFLFLSNLFLEDFVLEKFNFKKPQELIKHYEKLFGRIVIPTGDGKLAPQHYGSQHIDLYMMFLPQPGKEKPLIILPDPLLAQRLISGISTETLRKQFHISSLKSVSETKANQISAANRTLSESGLDDIHLSLDSFEKIYKGMLNIKEQSVFYDKLESFLTKQGFQTTRIPHLVRGVIINQNAVWSQPSNQINGFVEVKENHSVVTIPSYGIKAIDNFMINKFNSLGYSVNFIYGNNYFDETSGPHCLTNDRR